MSRVIWKEGNVVSVETRRGHFVLAQMSRSPYMVFYDAFRTQDAWDDIDASDLSVLFVAAVTRQFTRESRVTRQKKVAAPPITALPSRWIHPHPESAKLTLWAGTAEEREVVSAYMGGALVEMDILGHTGGPYRHPSGVFDAVVRPSIDPKDDATIDGHELDVLGVFPSLNERLYLCQEAGRALDPLKDVIFERPLPTAFTVYVDVTWRPQASEALLSLYR